MVDAWWCTWHIKRPKSFNRKKDFISRLIHFSPFYTLNFSRIEIVTQWKFNNFMELYIHEIIETIYNLYAVSYSESWASWYVTCEECNHRCSEIIYRDYAIRIHMRLFKQKRVDRNDKEMQSFLYATINVWNHRGTNARSRKSLSYKFRTALRRIAEAQVHHFKSLWVWMNFHRNIMQDLHTIIR